MHRSVSACRKDRLAAVSPKYDQVFSTRALPRSAANVRKTLVRPHRAHARRFHWTGRAVEDGNSVAACPR